MSTVINSLNSTIGASNSGVTNTLTVTNPSNTASSQAQALITVGGTSSGDPWTQWTVGTTRNYAIGIDNSSDDEWKLTFADSATGDPSSGTELIRVDQSDASGLGLTPIIVGGNDPFTGDFPSLLGVVGNFNGNGASIEIQNIHTAADAGSAAQLGIRVNGAGVSDPEVIYEINDVSGSIWRHGIDNSDSDKFKLKADATGTVEVMVATLSGEVTFPNTPAFLAYQASNAANASGAGTAYTLGSTVDLTEVFDQNSDFVPTTGTFTAPVTGRYTLGMQAYWNDLTIAQSFTNNITTDNQTFTSQQSRAAGAVDNSFYTSVLCDMDAGDAATFVCACGGEAGDTADLFGQAASPR